MIGDWSSMLSRMVFILKYGRLAASSHDVAGRAERAGRPQFGGVARGLSVGGDEKLLEHGIPRQRQVAPVVASAAKSHDAPLCHLVGEAAQTARRMRVRCRRILEMSKRIAGKAVGTALQNNELGPLLPEKRDDALPFAEKMLVACARGHGYVEL